MRIGVVIASTRPNRRGGAVADWLKSVTGQDDSADYTYLDLREINLPFLNEPEEPNGNYAHKTTRAWSKQIASQDAFVFVTPEYNHGYPASLKNAIDTLYPEWQGKPVGFVGYGHMGGARAIEQLLPVVLRVGLQPLTGTINIMIDEQFNNEGEFTPNDRNNSSIQKMIDRLKLTKQEG